MSQTAKHQASCCHEDPHTDNEPVRVLMVINQPSRRSTTFIRSHIERVDGDVHVVSGFPPSLETKRHRFELPIVVWSTVSMATEAARRFVHGVSPATKTPDRSCDHFVPSYRAAIKRVGPDLVFAEYGTVGARVLRACQAEGVPLLVHFHGHDATRRTIIESHRSVYGELFGYATSVVVSAAMRDQLIRLGCRSERIVLNPYGVDLERFPVIDAASNAPEFVAAGRFVPKKNPETTLRAFATLCQRHPDVRLRMIGDGPLLNPCRELARTLGIQDRVAFLGNRPHDVVASSLQRSRCFVQHSVVAEDGDSEGTPNAILEASATGLPVVATRHGGIPEAVVDGESGFLVSEGDVDAMATAMARFVDDPGLARQMGQFGRRHIEVNYEIGDRITRLNRAIRQVAARSGRGGQ